MKSESSWEDIEAGDGTTSVVVIAGALLGAAERLCGPKHRDQSRREVSKRREETVEGRLW